MSNRKLEDDRIIHDLRYAREFLNDESHWCKGVAWRRKPGPAPQQIRSACILGAVGFNIDQHNKEDIPLVPPSSAGMYIENQCFFERRILSHSIAYWNDNIATHKDILAFLDKAIKQRETELMMVVVASD